MWSIWVVDFSVIVTTGLGKSWNLGRPFSRPGKSWKTAKVMEKSWKITIMSCILWNFYNCTENCDCCWRTVEAEAQEQQMRSCWTDCCEIFVNMCKYTSGFIFLTVLVQAAGTVTTNSGMHLQVVYHLFGKNICCADRSWFSFFFGHGISHGKSFLKESGHPVQWSTAVLLLLLLLLLQFVGHWVRSMSASARRSRGTCTLHSLW